MVFKSREPRKLKFFKVVVELSFQGLSGRHRPEFDRSSQILCKDVRSKGRRLVQVFFVHRIDLVQHKEKFIHIGPYILQEPVFRLAQRRIGRHNENPGIDIRQIGIGHVRIVLKNRSHPRRVDDAHTFFEEVVRVKDLYIFHPFFVLRVALLGNKTPDI